MTRVYFAGPDIFRPDHGEHYKIIKKICAAYGLEPLCPGDADFDEPGRIFRANLDLIDRADGLIANLNPFRSPVEPDSGTVFECAYAYARKKFVIGLIGDQTDMLNKLKAAGAGPVSGRDEDPDSGGWRIENFGRPLNLMISEALTATASCLEEAVKIAAGLKWPA